MAQILISKLTVEDINSALLRLKRTIDNNEAAFDTKVNSAVSNLNIKNTYSAVQKYDDSQLRADINKVSDLIKDINSTLNQTNKYVSSNTEKISQLQTLLTNIDVTYDSETNTLSFTDYTGEEHDYELKDTTYTFSWDESTRTFTVTDDLTSDSQSFTFSDTKYNLSYSNGVLTFTPSSGTATNIDLKDTFYTESEIRTLVLDLIPNTASASNQLADKNWVNSSIETATATFRGTFTNINDLYATSGDNNDYAFLKTLDPQSGLYTYDRYKWTPNADPHWQYEYTINTSGFTADQLAALNSGITCTLVSKITDVYNCKITLCQNGTCVGSFTLNQNSDSSFNLDGGSISACAKTDNVWRNLLSTDCAATGSIDSACFSTNIKANSSTGIIQSMNTSNWGSAYSSNASCVGCYLLLAQLSGGQFSWNHDNTIGGVIHRNAAGVDVPYRFVISVRGNCSTVGSTYFITDKCSNIFYATYQAGTNAFTLRLYTKVTANYTRYNTRIDYLTNGDVSTRVSNWTCITFPNTYFAILPSTETQITRANFYTKCDVGLDNVDNTADTDKSVKNATCFNGCTYACACANIRSGLLSNICFDVYCDSTCKCTINNAGSLCLGTLAFSSATIPTVNDSTITLCLNGASKGTFTLNQAANCAIDLGCTICRSLEICINAINDNVDRPLAILGGSTSISNASIFVSCGCPLTFNASNGTLINGSTSATNPYLISRGCCIRLNKGCGQSELLFTINNDKTNYCSLGMGIGSGCINRGIYDCCGGTFRWLQYWDASDNEIHNRPTCAPYFRANYCGYIGFTFIKPDNSGNRAYYLLHDITNWYNGTTNVANRAFIGTITRNREGGYQNSGITSVDASYAYGRNGAGLTCYTNTQHSIYSHNIYTNITLRTAVLKDTTNNKYYSALEVYGSQSDFRFDGIIFGAICGTWVCTTNSSGTLPSGWELSYTGCLRGGKMVDVYCGATCKCTLYNGDNLTLKPNAFNDYAAISTTTYPGACCTGTLVASDLEPYQTTDCADSKYVFKCILAYPGGGSTCTRYVQIKALCSRALYGNTFRIGLFSMDATLNLDNSINHYCGTYYGDLKFSKCYYSCTNSDCFWLSYSGYRQPTICSSLPFEVLCTVTTAPSGITFSSFSVIDCLVKYSSVATSANRNLLMAAGDGVVDSICPVYFSGCVPLTFNANTGALNIGSDSLGGSVNSCGLVNAKWYCTTCCQATFSFPAQSTTYVLLGSLRANFSQNENQLGVFVSGTDTVNSGVLKILPTNASAIDQNNIELKLSNYCNSSYGITGIGFVRTGTAWNCSICVVLKVCNPASSANSWYVGIHRNQIKDWSTSLTCLGSTSPTFDKLIDVPTDCRTFYYNNAVACFSKIQGPAYDANGCAYITSSSVKDSTITLCLNGASKGTFTLNQATNCTIDLGSTICCANSICRNVTSLNVERPLALLGGITSISGACIFVSGCCQIVFNPSTGLLCSTRFNANGYPLKYRQTLNLSSLCADCFYPVTFGGDTSYEMDIEIQSPAGVGACPYNQNYIHFFIRNNGWGDTPHTLYVQTLRRYDNNENVFGCIGYGNQASTLSVIWLRGGRSYTANANVAMQVNSTNYTHPASGGSCSIYTVGTSLCGGTNTAVQVFDGATSYNHYVQDKSYFSTICVGNGIRGPACDANGCAYITAASLPTVNNPQITVKMNGASKGSFTLNQASAANIDLGCVICCADCVKKCLASSVDSYYIPYISSGNETYSPNMYDSNIQYCRVSESVGRLCSSCFEASCSILAKRYQTSSCTLSCSVTSGQTYYLYIGRFLNCPNNQGYSFTVNTSNASCIQDTVCIHLGNGASPSIKIDASNVLGTNGIQCIIFKCYGTECNLIYVAYKPEASQSVCFNFFQNNMSCCFIPAMTLSTSAPSSSNSTIICTKPNGTQAFHYVSGSQLTEGCLSADMVSGNNIKSNNGLILGVTSTCGYISCTCNFTYNRWVRLGCLITCSSDKNVPFTELNLHVKGNCSDDLAAIKISGLTCTPSINIDLAYKYLTSGISCFGFIYNPSTSDPFEVWALLQNNPDAGACVCSAWTLSNGIASERWCGGFTFCTTENAPTFTCKVAVCKVDTGAFSGNAWHWYNGYVSGSVTEADGFSNTKCVRIYAPNGCFCENQSNFAGDVVNLNIPECIGRMCCITTACMTVNSSLIIPRCHTSANYCIGEMWLTGI